MKKIIKLKTIINFFKGTGFIGGFLGGIIAALVIKAFIIDQQFEVFSNYKIDANELWLGKYSLNWQFKEKPELKFFFSHKKEMWCSLHLEVSDSVDFKGIDLSDFKGIKFYAKSTSEFMSLTEFNLFYSRKYFQFTYNKGPIYLTTKWQEYYIDFKDFEAASWEKEYRMNLSPKEPFFTNITALGIDIKTSSDPVFGNIWIDNIRLVDNNNKDSLLSECEESISIFQGKKMKWNANYGMLNN